MRILLSSPQRPFCVVGRLEKGGKKEKRAGDWGEEKKEVRVDRWEFSFCLLRLLYHFMEQCLTVFNYFFLVPLNITKLFITKN